jgi:hypothetical protein
VTARSDGRRHRRIDRRTFEVAATSIAYFFPAARAISLRSISRKHARQVTYERRAFVQIVLNGSAPQSAATLGASRAQIRGWPLFQ